jgi:hypothetical protein
MDELPRIDPSWTRRRRPPERENSFVGIIVASAVVLLTGAWMGRTHFEGEAAGSQAQRQSAEMAALARRRQADALEDERTVVHYISESQARELEGDTGSSIGDKAIHYCGYRGSDAYQLGPCKAPWVDVPTPQVISSRQRNVAEQAWMKERAEAQLRAEQRRYAALSGQQAGSWQPGYAPNPVDAARQRCEYTKAQRDEAYRLVGNNRTFDFIRHWDDVVFQACKGT